MTRIITHNIQLISISSSWMTASPMTLALLEEYAKIKIIIILIFYLIFFIHIIKVFCISYQEKKFI